MDYELRKLSDHLILIRWHRVSPTVETSPSERAFLDDLQMYLDAALEPLYFLSDLRHGHIASARTLRRLAQLTEHRNWGGGISVGNRPSTGMLVDSFEQMALNRTGDHLVASVSQAIQYLETLKPGITRNIDVRAAFEITARPGS